MVHWSIAREGSGRTRYSYGIEMSEEQKKSCDFLLVSWFQLCYPTCGSGACWLAEQHISDQQLLSWPLPILRPAASVCAVLGAFRYAD